MRLESTKAYHYATQPFPFTKKTLADLKSRDPRDFKSLPNDQSCVDGWLQDKGFDHFGREIISREVNNDNGYPLNAEHAAVVTMFVQLPEAIVKRHRLTDVTEVIAKLPDGATPAVKARAIFTAIDNPKAISPIAR